MSNQLTSASCGYVALLGAPNAGKSTLLNQLVGQKIAIVSPKPQTTRSRILGIALKDQAQILFLDTPGLFSGKKALEKAMLGAAWLGADDADIILLVVDSTRRQPDEAARAVIERVKKYEQQKPLWLVINKVDAATNKARLLPITQALHAHYNFAETFMVSAQTGEGVKALVDKLAGAMPQGPWLYDADAISDMPQRLQAAEMTREQLYLQLDQELPYSATVETDAWEHFDNGAVKITQSIIVERDGQKAIIIGKGGTRLKELGAAARAEMEKAFGQTIHLFLHVTVKENWQDSQDYYDSRGLTLGSKRDGEGV